MAQAHYNFYPPSGSVYDLDNMAAHWTGSTWQVNGRTYSVPRGHRLVGSPTGPLRGWTYDWSKAAWMEPDAPAQTSGAQAMPRPMVPFQPHPMAPHPSPPAIQTPQQPAAPQTQPTNQPATEPEKEIESVHKPQSVLEDLMKHPIAPLLGGGLLLVSYITDEPAPPPISPDLPEPIQKQVQMIFNQNQQRFARRMDLYRDLGMMLLGYAGTRSVVDVLGAARASGEGKHLAELCEKKG